MGTELGSSAGTLTIVLQDSVSETVRVDSFAVFIDARILSQRHSLAAE